MNISNRSFECEFNINEILSEAAFTVLRSFFYEKKTVSTLFGIRIHGSEVSESEL